MMYYNQYERSDVNNVNELKKYDDNISLIHYDFTKDKYRGKNKHDLNDDDKRKLAYRIRHSSDIYNGIKEITCRPDVQNLWNKV